MIAATLFAVVFYLWTTYSITIGYGVNNGAKFGADPVALKTTATTFVGSWLGTLVEIGGMLCGLHRVRRLRDRRVADPVRDGPRGRAARRRSGTPHPGSRRR